MRLWSLHPKYLDTKGLVAAWREALLAKHVLEGKTKGYKNHPQLDRFKAAQNPIAVINQFLFIILEESKARGYLFDASKCKQCDVSKIKVTKGQLVHELEHLKRKLKIRDLVKRVAVASVVEPEPHPLFEIVEGEIEPWERLTDAQ